MSHRSTHSDPPAVGLGSGTETSPRPTPPMLRVVLVGSNVPGLEETWIARAGRALRTRGHQVGLLVPVPGRGPVRAGEIGVDLQRVPAARWLDPRAGLELRRVLRDWKPDGVIAGDAAALRWIERARWGQRLVPIFVLGDEEGTASADPVRGATALRLDPRASAAIPVAAGVALAIEPVPPDRTRVRRELRLPRRGSLLLQVAPLVPGAGHEVLLRALAALRDEPDRADPDDPKGGLPTLVLVGTGPAETQLRELTHELGLQEHVLWVGYRGNTAPYVRAADALVVPTAGPGTRSLIHEALAAGTPVVAAEEAGFGAGIAADRTGLLVPSGEVEPLVASLARLLRDPGQATALAQAGHELAAAALSPARLGRQLECLLLAGMLARSASSLRGSAARRPAVFLDRDGTLVCNVPYNTDPEAVVVEPDAAWVLRCFAFARLARVVVSNQSAVARGLCGEAEVRAVNERLSELLRSGGADIEAFYFCPHHPEHGPPCTCRKPEPGLLLQAAQERRLDLARSVTIGDEPRDLEAGRRAGTASVRYDGSWLATCSTALTELLALTNR